MASVRFIDVSRPTEFLRFNEFDLEEFQTLVPPFETAFLSAYGRVAPRWKPGPPASLPSIRTAPCRHQKIGCSSSCLSQNLCAPAAAYAGMVRVSGAYIRETADMARHHRERHRTGRIGWLRAAVLGANDGIVSTASLVLGVAAPGRRTATSWSRGRRPRRGGDVDGRRGVRISSVPGRHRTGRTRA